MKGMVKGIVDDYEKVKKAYLEIVYMTGGPFMDGLVPEYQKALRKAQTLLESVVEAKALCSECGSIMDDVTLPPNEEFKQPSYTFERCPKCGMEEH